MTAIFVGIRRGVLVVATATLLLGTNTSCSHGSAVNDFQFQIPTPSVSIHLENLDRSIRTFLSSLKFAESLRDRPQLLQLMGERYTNDWGPSSGALPPLQAARHTIVGWSPADRRPGSKLERAPSRSELSEAFCQIAAARPALGESHDAPFSEKIVVYFEDQTVVPCILVELVFEGVDHVGDKPHVDVTCVGARVVETAALAP